MTSSVITAFSTSSDIDQAVAELRQQLNDDRIGFVLFFCSAEYDLDTLASALNASFGHLPIAGCTTAGEITPEGYAQGAISAIGFDRSHFTVQVGLIEAMEHFSLMQAQNVIDRLIRKSRDQQIAPVVGNSFVLTLLDGLSVQEEQVLISLNSALGNIPHFGGSAGDDIHLANTHVFANGSFHTGAAVVLLFNTDCDFEVFTTHHMQSLGDKLVVTAFADQAINYILRLHQGEMLHRLNESDLHRKVGSIEPDRADRPLCIAFRGNLACGRATGNRQMPKGGVQRRG
jgi:hypothetical protein